MSNVAIGIPGNVTSTSDNLTPQLSMITADLYTPSTGTGAGHIQFDESQLAIINAKKKDIIDYIRLRLGDGIVDVEADREHYDMAVKQALIRYRQKSSNSAEESYAFLDLFPETQEYIMPDNIMNIRSISRRGIGSVSGTTASQFEPFSSGYLNTYMLQAGRVGGLVNYELFAGYQELTMKMFGGYINFSFNKATKKLTIVRKIPWQGNNASEYESVLLHIDNLKPDIMLLNDYMAYPWIQDYAYALAMGAIGEAREKFASIAGPQGGTTLNGAQLKTQSQAMLDKLDLDIKNYADGGTPLTWVTG